MPEIHDPAGRRTPRAGSAGPETREVVHELANILAAMRVEIFIADRTRARTRPAEEASNPPTSPRETAHENHHPLRSRGDLLTRLDRLTDRAIELTEILGERERRVPWEE